MLNDSDIINYSIYSMESGAGQLLKKIKYYKPNNNIKLIQKSISRVESSRSTFKRKSILFKLKREFKTCICVICFLIKFKIHSLKFYLLLLCLMTLFTQMIQGGYISAIITSLQNQFNLSTSKIGYILAAYDIMSVISSPIVAYIGSRYNKAKIIGTCGFIYVVGAIMFTLPYFFGQKYTVFNKNNQNNQFHTESHLCTNDIHFMNEFTMYENFSNKTTRNSQTKVQNDAYDCKRDLSNTWSFYNFIICQLLMSIGVSPIFSLGTTYLCDNLDSQLHAFYSGIFYGAYALGPAIGYLTASYFLSLWINKFTETNPPISDNDPRWVGLWFLGFFISAGFILILSIIMITFPENLTRKSMNLKGRRKLKNKSKPVKAKTKVKNDMSDCNKSFNLNDGAPRLETIDEVSELVDKNFEFLNTISYHIDNIDGNNVPQSSIFNKSATVNNLVMPNDSVSAHIVFQSQSSSINKTMNYETNSVAMIENKKFKNSYYFSCCYKLVTFKLKLIGFGKCLLKLFLNYRYVMLILTISTDCILLALFTNYMVLYCQNNYQLSSSKSSILVGAVIIPAAIFGAIFGGFLVRKFNLKIEGCTRLIIISSMIVLGGIFALIFIKCDLTFSIGIDSINNGFNSTIKTCNKNCNCDSSYNPVCGNDGITYVSPCYGYADCNCLLTSNSNKTNEILAKPGACSKGCDNKLVIFLIVLFIVVSTESICITPAIILVLMVIDKPLQSFALGLMRCINTLFATLPARIVLSQFIDNTCILWNSKCLGDKSTCLEYDTKQFHLILFGSSAGIKIVSCCILISFTFFIHKSYIRRRHYMRNVKLNHDATTVLTPKQKYMIDSEVASLAKSSKSNNQLEKSLRNETSKKNKKWIESVVLKSQRSFDEFTSFDRSQTPDFFSQTSKTNLNINSDQ